MSDYAVFTVAPLHAISFLTNTQRKLFIESRHWSCRAVNLTNVLHTHTQEIFICACASFLFLLYCIQFPKLSLDFSMRLFFFGYYGAGSSMPRSMCLSVCVCVFINFHLEMSVKIILKSVKKKKIDMNRAQESTYIPIVKIAAFIYAPALNFMLLYAYHKESINGWMLNDIPSKSTSSK